MGQGGRKKRSHYLFCGGEREKGEVEAGEMTAFRQGEGGRKDLCKLFGPWAQKKNFHEYGETLNSARGAFFFKSDMCRAGILAQGPEVSLPVL